MENTIYINIAIRDLGNGTVMADMAQSVNDEPLTITQLDLNHARKLMWELVLAGGVREYHNNMFDRSIISVNTYIFLPC